MLQPVDCKPITPVKRKFLKISWGATFNNIPMHVKEFPTELQNSGISSVTLPKSDLTTDILPAKKKQPPRRVL